MPGAHPYSLARTLQNPLARMLPLFRECSQVYRMGESNPPSGPEDGYAPEWECVTAILPALATTQARISVQRNFTLLAINASSISLVAGGFRAQLYDVSKKVRLADRGLQTVLIGGTQGTVSPSGPFFLREPYPFHEHDAQILVQLQNLEAVQNSIQLVLYGVCLPFNLRNKTATEYPGGPVSSSPKTSAETRKEHNQ
ncbi:MAG TPA: hypothetical protein VJX23_02930 [Candidatus Binataceae bacterium]|nr:hypothetical protein [Candidatus Binataceae bacterium]